MSTTAAIVGKRDGCRRSYTGVTMSDITISLPDGSAHAPRGCHCDHRRPGDRPSPGQGGLAARVDGEEWDLGRVLPDDAEVAIITV